MKIEFDSIQIHNLGFGAQLGAGRDLAYVN
jgi:hypothetical protein